MAIPHKSAVIHVLVQLFCEYEFKDNEREVTRGKKKVIESVRVQVLRAKSDETMKLFVKDRLQKYLLTETATPKEFIERETAFVEQYKKYLSHYFSHTGEKHFFAVALDRYLIAVKKISKKTIDKSNKPKASKLSKKDKDRCEAIQDYLNKKFIITKAIQTVAKNEECHEETIWRAWKKKSELEGK